MPDRQGKTALIRIDRDVKRLLDDIGSIFQRAGQSGDRRQPFSPDRPAPSYSAVIRELAERYFEHRNRSRRNSRLRRDRRPNRADGPAATGPGPEGDSSPGSGLEVKD